MSRPRAKGDRSIRGQALRLHGSIARDLGTAIVSGLISSHTVLDGEVEASKKFGVSRTAYREAIRTLAAKGLVDPKPRAGTRVSDAAHWQLLDPDVLSWIFASDPPAFLIARLFELRRIIESAAAALAAERRTLPELQKMELALKQMEASTLSTEEGRNADNEFHSMLLKATRNPFLVSLSDGIGAAVNQATIFRLNKTLVQRDPVPDHWRVFHAIAGGDAAEAAATMTALIGNTYMDTKSVSENTLEWLDSPMP